MSDGDGLTWLCEMYGGNIASWQEIWFDNRVLNE